jgi:tetratricopeptide (TPR) repeat protein
MGGDRRIELSDTDDRMMQSRIADRIPQSDIDDRVTLSHIPVRERFANEAWAFNSPQKDLHPEQIEMQFAAFQMDVTRAGNLQTQLKQIQGLSQSDSIRVQDSNGAVQSVNVAELRRQLNDGINNAYKESIRRLDRIDPVVVERTIANAAAELKKNPNQAEAIRDIETIEICERSLKAGKDARIAWSTYLVDRAVDNMAFAGAHNQNSTQDFKAASDILNKISNQDRKTDGRVTGLLETIVKAESGKLDQFLPALLCEQALVKVAAGNSTDAESLFKQAIARSDANGTAKNVDPALDHLSSNIRIQYMKALIQSQKLDDATVIHDEVLKLDRDFALRNTEFRTIDEALFFKGKPENPYANLSKLQAAFERKDMQSADRYLRAFEEGAKEVNRDRRQTEKIKELKELIDKEKDVAVVETLKQELAIREAYLRAPLVGDYLHGRLALAAGDKVSARALFEHLESVDSGFTSDPKLEMHKLIEMCNSVDQSGIWATTKNLLKELSCDVVAISAGIGAAVLTGWTGPGALAVGGGAGAISYTGMKALVFGTDSITWTTPLWGALDGISGGGAALARNGLTKFGGRLITKELAERTVLQAGGEVAGLVGLEGFELGGQATVLARQGLKQVGSELPLLTRFRSVLPLAGGDAEYRAALNGYRSIRNTYYGLNAVRDFGATATSSFIFNTGKGVTNYYEGKTDFLETSSDILSNTTKDGAIGVLFGPAGRRIGSRFADTSMGSRLGFPLLNEYIPGAIAPRLDDAYDRTKSVLDIWLEQRRMRRGLGNDEIYDRYLKDIPGTADPREILRWKRN